MLEAMDFPLDKGQLSLLILFAVYNAICTEGKAYKTYFNGQHSDRKLPVVTESSLRRTDALWIVLMDNKKQAQVSPEAEDLHEQCPLSAIRLAPFSDHHLVTITVSLHAERPGPAYWHFNNSLLEDERFVTFFREFWLAWREQWRAFPSVRRLWGLGKVRAKLFCRDYTRGTSRRRNAAIEQLEREILEMERRLAANPEDPSLCGACREKREELRALEDHRA
ncbi:unnamed protein product [Caretta caretta]